MTDSGGATDPTPTQSHAVTAGRTPLEECARRTERFVARAGWDQPPRLFALVATDRLLAAEPHLSATLPAPDAEQTVDQLSSIEQEGWVAQLDPGGTLDGLLAALAWPPEVDGAALIIERVVAAHGTADPTDSPAPTALPEVRLCVAVLRDGSGTCLLRHRSHDADDLVASGPQIAPALVRALAATLLAD